LVETILLTSLLILASISDIRTYKIKNIITLPYVLAGMIINIYINGVNNLLTFAIDILIPIICLIPFYSLKMLGAGNIKLFSAISAIMGHRFVLLSMVFSFLVGGVIALLIMLIRKNFKKRFAYLFQYLKNCFITFSIQSYTSIGSESKDAVTEDVSGRFPFAIAVSLGTAIALLIG
jgi:prepilin peptidase CpaA